MFRLRAWFKNIDVKMETLELNIFREIPRESIKMYTKNDEFTENSKCKRLQNLNNDIFLFGTVQKSVNRRRKM